MLCQSYTSRASPCFLYYWGGGQGTQDMGEGKRLLNNIHTYQLSRGMGGVLALKHTSRIGEGGG